MPKEPARCSDLRWTAPTTKPTERSPFAGQPESLPIKKRCLHGKHRSWGISVENLETSTATFGDKVQSESRNGQNENQEC